MSTLEELIDDTNIMVTTLRVPYRKVPLGTSIQGVFELEVIGVVIVCIFPEDYSFVLDKLEHKYKGYRYIFITTSDNMFEKKDEVIWDLMRSGYIRYIRINFPRQFTNIIQQGFGQKIIGNRLKIWGDKAKYKFLVKEHKECLKASIPAVLNYDAAFFDYMPEILEQNE